jgi:heme-degrading monooxygenase HmoA
MFVVMNRISVNPDYNDAFVERFSDRASLVDRMPGFVSFQLMQPIAPDDPFIVMTVWQDEAAFDAWTESDEFKQGHARAGQLPPEAFRGRPVLESYQVISDAQAGEIL